MSVRRAIPAAVITLREIEPICVTQRAEASQAAYLCNALRQERPLCRVPVYWRVMGRCVGRAIGGRG